MSDGGGNRIDPKSMNQAFQRGLRNGKLIFLDELKQLALDDYELQGDGVLIRKAFEMMKKFVGDKGVQIDKMELRDWQQFGLEAYIINRIGYLSFYYDSMSPKGRRKLAAKSTSIGTIQSDDNYYDDDFEEDEDDIVDESVSTLRNNFMGVSNQGSSIHSEYSGHSNDRYSKRTFSDDSVNQDTSNFYRNKPTIAESKQSGFKGGEDIESDIEEYVEEDEGAEEVFSDLKSPSRLTTKRLVESPVRVIRKMNPTVGSSPPLQRVQQQPTGTTVSKLRPQSTMSALPVKSSASVKSTSMLPRAMPEEQRVRATTADPNSSSYALRNRENAASVSTSKGKTPGWITRKEWRLGEKIGSGSFGEVFQGMNNKGKLFAVKRMNMLDKSSEVDGLLSEIQLMRGFSHIHIVEYLGAMVDAAECMLYIFQEWVPGGSVAHLLKNFGPFALGVIRNYTRQILYGLQYLHSNGIIHRDIKGGNILVDDVGTVKLADFGASTKLSAFDKTQETTTIKGTPYFMAPEVLANSRYGRKGDIWAVGCTMIQMLTGEPPWKDRNLKGLVQLHMLLSSWDQGPPPYKEEVSAEARQCLVMCFQKNEIDRPTASDLLDCDFLRDDADDMDESFAVPRTHDSLDDSGILSGLKSDMHKAVSRSSVGLQGRGGDDTMAVIERQIQERAQRNSRQKLPANPFGNRASQQNPFASNNNPLPASNPARPQPVASIVEDRTAQWADGLPPSQFDKPSTPPYQQNGTRNAHTPPQYPNNNRLDSQPREVVLRSTNAAQTPTHRLKVSKDIAIPSSVSASRASSSNPFGKGNSVLKASPTNSHMMDTYVDPKIGAPNGQYQQQPSHHTVGHKAAAGGHASNTELRESLHSIKKKVAGVAGSSAASQQQSNVSSNRDEELTPLSDYASDSEVVTARTQYHRDDDEPYYSSNRHSSHYQQQQRGGSTSSSGNNSRPSSRPDSKQTDSRGGRGGYGVSMPAPVRREDTLDQIDEFLASDDSDDNGRADERRQDYRGGRSDHRTPSHQHQRRGSEDKSSSGSRGRDHYNSEHPHIECEEDDSEPELLVCSPSKVPAAGRLNNIPPSVNLSSVTPQTGPDSGRLQKITPTHQTGNNGGGGGNSGSGIPAISSALNKPLSAKSRSKFNNLPSAGTASRPTSGNSDHQQVNSRHRVPSYEEEEDNQRPWACLKCGAANTHPSHCESCATLRGADGRRGLGAQIRRL